LLLIIPTDVELTYASYALVIRIICLEWDEKKSQVVKPGSSISSSSPSIPGNLNIQVLSMTMQKQRDEAKWQRLKMGQCLFSWVHFKSLA